MPIVSPCNLTHSRIVRFARSRMSIAAAMLLAIAAATGAIAIPTARAGQTVTVTMTDEPARFVPQDIKIKVGTKVEWKNTGATLHTVTFDPSLAQVKSHVSLPKGVKPFDSGFMPPGATYSQTFTVPGEYKYICIPHEANGMIGEVDVKK
jgi:plastocyanin